MVCADQGKKASATARECPPRHVETSGQPLEPVWRVRAGHLLLHPKCPLVSLRELGIIVPLQDPCRGQSPS